MLCLFKNPPPAQSIAWTILGQGYPHSFLQNIPEIGCGSKTTFANSSIQFILQQFNGVIFYALGQLNSIAVCLGPLWCKTNFDRASVYLTTWLHFPTIFWASS